MAMADENLLLPRIVLVPVPAQGHLPALLTLATSLASQGFPITLVNIQSVHEKLVKIWEESPPDYDFHLESIPFRMQIPKALDGQAAYNRAALITAFTELIDPFERLIARLVDQGRPRKLCILADYHVPWTTPAARKFNVPQICFFAGSVSWTLLEYHLPQLRSEGFFPVPDDDEEFQNRMISSVSGMDPFKASELPFLLRERSIGGDVERMLARVPRLHTDEWILVNSFEELEAREVEEMRKLLGVKFIPIGPLLNNQGKVVSLETEDTKCIEWLSTRPNASVLYISFGSLAIVSSRQFEELAMALENQSCLWVIRPEFLAAAGVPEELYRSFAGRTAETGHSMIVAWAPQQKVLSHCSIGGFLTHCGWNSTLESIWNGVPMLAWPCNSDQNLNARLTVEGKGIGKAIAIKTTGDSSHLITRDEVKQLVEDLMTSDRIKQAAATLKQSARRTATTGGTSHTNLQHFINCLKESVSTTNRPVPF